jgi:hypothetical protein
MEKDENFLLDPNNIPGIDYYLEDLKGPNNSYPKRPNHSPELTIEGFCNVANVLIKPFGAALERAREINSARQ